MERADDFIFVDTSQVSPYTRWLRAQVRLIEAQVCHAFRGWAVHIHADIATLSPQWSGNLAANWMIDLNGTPRAAESHGDPEVRGQYQSANPVFGKDPYSRGMLPAVEISMARGEAFGTPRVMDSIYIYNPVPYAEDVEDDLGPRPIRAVNRLPRSEQGKIAMVIFAYEKYNNLPVGADFTRTS